MVASSTVTELHRLIQNLQQERQHHADAIAAIDAAYKSMGISPKPAVRRGRRPGWVKAAVAPAGTPVLKVAGKRRGRRKAKDGMTGDAFLLSVLAGSSLATADVNKKWAASGRKGAANNLLGKLVKEGRIKRKKGKEERGSVYSAA